MAWIVVGLGNPGEEYEATRHNTGRMGVEFLAKKSGASAWKEDKTSKSRTTGARIGRELLALVLPETFMNKSGFSAAKFVKSVKAAEKLIVVYDDLDLPLGTFKISFNRGSGGHKGIDSIARFLKTKRFVRVRVGISPATAGGAIRKPHGEKEVEKFILGQFKSHEMEELQRVYKKVCEAIEAIVSEGREIAMTRFN